MEALLVILFAIIAVCAAVYAILSGPTFGIFGLGVFPRKRADRADDASDPDSSKSR